MPSTSLSKIGTNKAEVQERLSQTRYRLHSSSGVYSGIHQDRLTTSMCSCILHNRLCRMRVLLVNAGLSATHRLFGKQSTKTRGAP